jgi:transcriptional regulator ATRX
MEEKIYERQVTKETLSQRVIDEHQIDRHFTQADLQELYKFDPDLLNNPNWKPRPTPAVPTVSLMLFVNCIPLIITVDFCRILCWLSY